MLYFSEIKNTKVLTEDNEQIGVVNDLVFRFTETPYITKILIRPTGHKIKEKIFLPIEDVVKFNNPIIIKKKYHTAVLQENELFILRNLIDKQIIDIDGRKVVRVNDAIVQQKGNSFIITGVDVGLLGILRWLGIEKIIEKFAARIYKPIPSAHVSWSNIQPLELSRGKVVLNTHQEKLEKLHPADLADYLEVTNLTNISKILDLVDKDFAAEVVAELNLSYQISVLKKLGLEKTVKIISLIDPDEAVDILTQFSPHRRKDILKNLNPEKRKELEELLSLGGTAVGKYLTTEFLTAESADIAAKILDSIKKRTSHMPFFRYVYIINNDKQMVGTTNLHDLVLEKSDAPVYKFMSQNVNVAHLNTSVYTVFRKLIKYKMSELPVVDSNKKILGIVTIDDIGGIFLDKI